MPRRRACRCSCSRSRRRPSGSISTSSRKAVDEYFSFLDAYPGQPDDQRLGNPVWHIHSGNPPAIDMPITFAMLLNLASASNAHDKGVLWGFILRHVPGVTPESHPEARRAGRLCGALLPRLRRAEEGVPRPGRGRAARRSPRSTRSWRRLPADARGRGDPERRARCRPRHPALSRTRRKTGPDGGPGVSLAWFATLYQILLGQERGPRFGSFVAIYGIPETRALIGKALAGELTA